MADGDPQFWSDIRAAVDEEHANDFVSRILDDSGAPKPSDPMCQPQYKRKADAMDKGHNATLAALLAALLERPYQETAVTTYDFWREGDGDQRLQFVIRDYLELFRDIMRDPRWKEDFDLVFHAIFDVFHSIFDANLAAFKLFSQSPRPKS